MSVIKLPNGDTKEDQRKNGARLKLTIADWIKIICLLVAIILAFGHLQWQVAANCDILNKYTKIVDNDTVKIKISEKMTEQIIATIKEDIREIKADVADIKKLLLHQ